MSHSFNKNTKTKDQSIIMIGAFGAALVGIFIVGFAPDLIGEVCSKKFIRNDIISLKSDLEENVFGQHLAKKLVSSILESYVTDNNLKALTLHFYGPTGTGKNLVTSYIAKNILNIKGTKSRYFHYFNGISDFSNAEKIKEYREYLKEYVPVSTRYCGTNIFVFDEVDKMVPGVLDALLPYVEASRPMNNLDYRKNIFIFLSNSSGEDIFKLTSKLLEDGKKREEITYEDMLPLIKKGKNFQNSGFKDSVIKNLITLDVPFLPLEKEHVKKCIRAELKEKKWLVSDDSLENIANELVYVEKERFSHNGCRKVKVKTDLYISEFLSKA